MPELLNVQDLLRLAIAVEENGRQVYEHFEEEARDDGLKATWSFLKAEEEVHAGRFRKLLDRLRESPTIPDPYLNVIASNTIFTDGRLARKIFAGIDSDLDALDFAILIEKESVFTYLTLKDRLPPDARAVVDQIVEEEKKHLAQLADIRQRLAARKPG